MADVFLSYKKEERAEAERVVLALEAAAYSVWWDDNLTPRSSWDAEIERELKAAKAVLVLWSPLATDEISFVRIEASYAKDHGKLVPARIERCDLPLRFRDVQTADLTGWDRCDPEHAEWRRTLRWLSLLVGRQPRPFSVPPTPKDRALDLEPSVPEAGGSKPPAGLDSLNIAVIGGMKVGKSTLLNALLAPVETMNRPLLPMDDLPCTATLVKLRYSGTPYCRPHVWDRTRNSFGAAMHEWSFTEFHERARIYINGRESNISDSIAFEVGLPSPLLRAGVTLLDTPGTNNDSYLTEITRSTLAEIDAAIIVYRSDALPGEAEIEFHEEVLQRVAKVFTIVNLWRSTTASTTLETQVRRRLSLNPRCTLEEQDVFFVQLKDATDVSYAMDLRLMTDPGFLNFQDRLAQFAASERSA